MTVPSQRTNYSMAEVWKAMALFFAGLLSSGLGFYLVEGRTHASGKEVREMIDELSPYRRDKGTIFTRLDSIQEDLRDIKGLLNNTNRK